MAFGYQVGELLAGHTERNHERQVVQQFERCRHPVLLIRIAARHQPQAVPPRGFGTGHWAAHPAVLCAVAMSSILLTDVSLTLSRTPHALPGWSSPGSVCIKWRLIHLIGTVLADQHGEWDARLHRIMSLHLVLLWV
jgi:hypothetical protein